jgi:hypothetical protein
MYKAIRQKQRLEYLKSRLENGDDVAVRDLKNALTAREFSEYENKWEVQQQSRSLGDHGSSGYEDFLKQGLLHYNKAECGRFNKEDSKRFHRKAETCFEKALEQLKVDVQLDPVVEAAYDRPLDFSASGNLSLDPVGMPRRIDSKSLDNLIDVHGGASVKVTKRSLKIQIVKQSLADFENRKERKEREEREECEEGRKDEEGRVGRVGSVRGLYTQRQKLAELRRKLNLAQR